MARVTRSRLTPDSALRSCVSAGDFLDCYAVPCAAGPRKAAAAFVAFPGWIRALLGLRALLTGPLGLRSAPRGGGDRIGPFPILDETGEELIAGFDDRHLDFRISVMSREGRLSVATWVRPHNVWGRLYLAAVLPFHILIVRDGLARAARAYMSSSSA